MFISFANAEIYSWIDENGRKHFGNEIPHEYSSQLELVPVDIDTPTDEEISNAKEINKTIRSAGTTDRGIDKKSNVNSNVNSKPATGEQVSEICLKKRKAYLDSMSCLDSCVSSSSNEMVKYREQKTSVNGYKEDYISSAPMCKKCRVVNKPDC